MDLDENHKADKSSNHIIHELRGNLLLFRPTLRLIRRYTTLLKESTNAFNANKDLSKKNLRRLKRDSRILSNMRSRIEANVSKMMNLFSWMMLIVFVGIGGVAVYFFVGRVEEAHVTVRLSAHYTSVRTHNPASLKVDNDLLLSSTGPLSIRNAFFLPDYPFPDTVPVSIQLKPATSEPVGIKRLAIPDSTNLTFDIPARRDLYISFLGAEGLQGFVPLRNVIAYSPDNRDSMSYTDDLGYLAINFQPDKNELLQIVLNEPQDFQLPPFYVQSVKFGQRKDDIDEYGIISGHISILETGDSIRLHTGDLFQLSLTQPAKVMLRHVEGRLEVEFTAAVNRIYAGPDIFGQLEPNDQMPKIWKVNRELLGILLIIAASVLPAVIAVVFRTRRSL